MATVTSHYASHLAPVYLWMAGGIDHALATGTSDLVDLASSGGVAVDLGAGFGMHAIPLARSGYRVLAVDSSELLLGQLKSYAAGLPIDIVRGDLVEFRRHLAQDADLILCMGDTLTHLEDQARVETLFGEVAGALAPGGKFVATFRDYSTPRRDESRFIPVRSDPERILTCFLEEQDDHVIVYDVLHERTGDAWNMSVSSYRKLRLSGEGVTTTLEAVGLKCSVSSGPRGMVRVVAVAKG
jgi:SAM-dependent methyltransferase